MEPLYIVGPTMDAKARAGHTATLVSGGATSTMNSKELSALQL